MEKSGMHVVYISVGSNLGDKRLNCQKGIDELTKPEISDLKNQSNFYKTSPVDYLDQDWFINAAVQIETSLDPLSLLSIIKSIEIKAGRTDNKIRYGPRILDLDIIFYDNLILNSTKIIIPHPQMHKRCFVLKPICDINPFILHPIFNRPVKNLLNSLDHKSQKVHLFI